MNAYRVKEIMWLFIAITMILISLAGCSSTPRQQAQNQYCYTKQDITVQDKQTVSSQTKLQCSDDPIDQVIVRRLGVAPNCGYVNNWRVLPNGREINDRQLVCQGQNGRWMDVTEFATGR